MMLSGYTWKSSSKLLGCLTEAAVFPFLLERVLFQFAMYGVAKQHEIGIYLSCSM